MTLSILCSAAREQRHTRGEVGEDEIPVTLPALHGPGCDQGQQLRAEGIAEREHEDEDDGTAGHRAHVTRAPDLASLGDSQLMTLASHFCCLRS